MSIMIYNIWLGCQLWWSFSYMGHVSQICLADLCEANLKSREILHHKGRQWTSSISYLALHSQRALLNIIIDWLPDRYRENLSCWQHLELKYQDSCTWAFHSSWGEVTTNTLSYYPRVLLQWRTIFISMRLQHIFYLVGKRWGLWSRHPIVKALTSFNQAG